MQQSIDISYPPGPQPQTCSSPCWKGRLTDGRIPYRYIDPASRAVRVVPIRAQSALINIGLYTSVIEKMSVTKTTVLFKPVQVISHVICEFAPVHDWRCFVGFLVLRHVVSTAREHACRSHGLLKD